MVLLLSSRTRVVPVAVVAVPPVVPPRLVLLWLSSRVRGGRK